MASCALLVEKQISHWEKTCPSVIVWLGNSFLRIAIRKLCVLTIGTLYGMDSVAKIFQPLCIWFKKPEAQRPRLPHLIADRRRSSRQQ
jgi:hypothetical protein